MSARLPCVALALGLALIALGLSAPASAAPAWRIDSVSNTTAAPGGTHTFYVQITNVGDADADGASEPIVVAGTLPSGMTVARAEGGLVNAEVKWDCSAIVPGTQSFSCTDATETLPARLAAASQRVLTFQAAVDQGATGTLTSSFAVTGGGAMASATASTVDPATISATPPPFGVDAFDGTVVDAAGGRSPRPAGIRTRRRCRSTSTRSTIPAR